MAQLDMNKWFIALGIWGALISCQQAQAPDTSSALNEIPIEGSFSNADLIRNPVSSEGNEEAATAGVQFSTEIFNFGEVEEGEKVTYAFDFVNTGKVPLLISRAYSTCGCTVPEWPETPVPPGGKGSILVRFDTEGKTGVQKKPIYITANTLPATSTVYLTGLVRAKK